MPAPAPTPPAAPPAPASTGDEAPPGAPGSGETVCPDCGGSGRRHGQPCATCRGSGKVNAGIGGG